MRQLLITGGAGFIGCNFVHYWMNKYPKDTVVVLDALTYAGHRDNLAPVAERDKFTFVHGNICDEALVTSLLREHHIDTVVHFAAESHVDRSITGPDLFIETNVVGTHTLLKAVRRFWLDEGVHKTTHRFHHVSTDEVYGSLGPDDPPFTETTPYAPNSPYSASKAASDHLVRAYHHTYGLQVTTSNCSNNFGPYQHEEKLIPTIIRKALHGEPIPIYGEGVNIRDWLYVEDHCAGIEAILLNGTVGEVYNIGGDNEWSNLDLTKKICQLLDEMFAESSEWGVRYPQCPAVNGEKCERLITFVTDRAGHDFRYGVDGGKIQAELGYQPTLPFSKHIQVTVEWFLD